MGVVVRYETREGVAWVTVDNPPVNALVQPVRAGIDAAIARATDDPEVGAIVIAAAGRTFPAGTDVRDFHRSADQPGLDEVCDRIEACPKPVIAAVHGMALGGGLELAMACHYRLALAGTHFGLPEVTLGVVPTAGGTQRLPRLIGPARALQMLLSGRPVKAKPAERAGLIDKVVRRSLDQFAQDTARELARTGGGPRPTAARTRALGNPGDYLKIVAARRAGLEGNPQVAAHRAVDLVEAALLLPFAAGLEKERATYDDLVDGPQAQGLRHIFLAERRSARAPQLAGAEPREIGKVAVLGHGDEAAGVVRACLVGGLSVLAVERDEAARMALRARIVGGLSADIQSGRLAEADRDAALDRFESTGADTALTGVTLVIEAVDGDRAARREAVAEALAASRADTMVASSLGGEELTELAAPAGRAGDALSLYMPAPAQRTRLVEVAAPARGKAELAATGIAFARRINRVPVVLAHPAAGLLSGALDEALFAAGEAMALTGVDPAEIDAALRAAGLPLGPFEKADRGLLRLELGQRGESKLIARMRDAGWTGRAAGQGFYHYGADGRALATAPEALHLIAALREASRVPAAVRLPDRDEILRRSVLAMANAGAALVAAGIVQRPSDVDVAAVHGLRMPRWLGGPMAMADDIGLGVARKQMYEWAGVGDLARAVWNPVPLIDRLIRQGAGFGSLNG